MARNETDLTAIAVEKGTEKARDKLCMSKDLGCQIQFQIRNVVFATVLVIGFFLLVTQYLLPLTSFDTKKIWCADTVKLNSLEEIQPKHYDPLSQEMLHEKVDTSLIDVSHGELQVFKPHGLATHLYIEMSAYRGGPREFSVVGLISKPIETHHKPPFVCEWVPNSGGQAVKGRGHKVLPDWNYGKLYTVVVITCYFAEDVGVNGEGGELILHVSYGDQYRQPERIVVLEESKGVYNASIFNPQSFPYDYVYCGSSVYGNISPQRMREWMAYHAKFFGEKSHFILHDSGGFHEDVRRVLEPWVKQGRVTLRNIRQQELYDGYYHNQFLVVNDCLFRSRFMANWTFFFDIDEYMYMNSSKTLANVLNRSSDVTQVTIEQVPVANGVCVADNTTKGKHERKWGFEKLVYRKVLKRGVHYDRKYAVQARHAEAAGIHMSMNMHRGKHVALKRDQIRYYHYHGSINKRNDVCSIFVDPRNATAVLSKYESRLDKTMANIAKDVKSYELHTIGTQPFIV